MDQARSTISKIFNGEPHSYTRFNLTQNMEGDNSHVEMKLSSDMDEEADGNSVGAHLNHNSNHTPYVAQKLGRIPKNLCFMAAMTLLIFIIGYLIGYLVHRNKEEAPVCSASVVPWEDSVPEETGGPPLMDWADVKQLFAQRFTAAKLEQVLSDLSSTTHRAGSPGDEDLAKKVFRKFKEYSLSPWTEEHFVKVQDPPVFGYNRVVLKNGTEEHQMGFLSYSATGTSTGAVLYACYGQESDFSLLRDMNIEMSGRVMLIRAGKISYAEKVANAAKMNATAVLIYPDVEDYQFDDNTPLYGHVHLGSGDPYTPGFPSFNHTQFPPIQSSGLPNILAQTITKRTATNIQRTLGGQPLPSGWKGFHSLGDLSDNITVEVNNVLTEKKINNVFSVIKGFVDPDRYVIIGAQRDAWGPGFAASTMGTSVLVELARSISDMVKNDGFKPRRSIVFASFSAGEYGSVGATEWLEGYLSSLSMKAFSYINLDRIVSGQNGFKVAASPLLYRVIENTLKEVKIKKDASLASQFASGNWESSILEPLKVDSAAYPFMALSGIPSVSFRFASDSEDYKLIGTMRDTQERLNQATNFQVSQLGEVAGKFAGHIVLRLVHDHLLQLDLERYNKVLRSQVAQINGKFKAVHRLLPPTLTMQWLISAVGSFGRASRGLAERIQNSNLDDVEMCRLLNDRIMAVEKSFLSPYVSPTKSPFHHILLGSGPHTLKALSSHLEGLRANTPKADAELFLNQFALATWTIQGCANSLVGDIWSLDNEI